MDRIEVLAQLFNQSQVKNQVLRCFDILCVMVSLQDILNHRILKTYRKSLNCS